MIPSFRAGTSSDDQQAASSLTSPNFFNMMNQEYRRTSHPMNSQRDQHMVYKNVMHGESSDQEMNSSSNSQSFEVDERQSDDGSTYKWMPLKMRLVRKMKNPNPTMRIMKNMNDDQQQQYHSNRMSNDVVRVCSDCNTTRTPLWRSGPQGPKTLCNACGIRQRKARRAAAGGGATAPYPTTGFKIQNKEKSSNFQEIKKKPPNPLGSSKKGKELSFEDFALSLSKNSDFQRVFPKDEEEAAILLMALSSGLICSS